MLAPGGTLLFSNIAAGNPFRPWIEYLADWTLIERDEKDLEQLVREAGFPVDVGDGHARNVYLDLVLPIPLKGFAIVKVVQPSLPKALGSLDVGSTRRVRIELDVPGAVKLLSLTEVGHFQNVKGSLGAFVGTQKFVP